MLSSPVGAGTPRGPVAAPRIGVAVIELIGGEALRRCIASAGGPGQDSEVVVALRDVSDTLPARTIPAAGGTIPLRRRRAAIELAKEPDLGVAVLVEDSTVLCPDWRQAVAASFAGAATEAVWGPVEVSRELPARYRALGRLEYGRFDGSNAGLAAIPGNLIVLKASALHDCLADQPEGLVEGRLPMSGDPARCAFSIGLRASYSARDEHGARLATRFGHGRVYGASDSGGLGPAGRLLRALRAVAGAGFLAARALAAARRAAGVSGAAAEAPWIAAMSLVWAAGEATGAMLGTGRSMESWT